jgi:hypothetical protein
MRVITAVIMVVPDGLDRYVPIATQAQNHRLRGVQRHGQRQEHPNDFAHMPVHALYSIQGADKSASLSCTDNPRRAIRCASHHYTRSTPIRSQEIRGPFVVTP